MAALPRHRNYLFQILILNKNTTQTRNASKWNINDRFAYDIKSINVETVIH